MTALWKLFGKSLGGVGGKRILMEMDGIPDNVRVVAQERLVFNAEAL